MRFLIALFSILLCLTSARADTSAEITDKHLTLSVHARPTTNLIYQLDCMADLIHCAPDIFQSLWHNELGFDAEDQRQLDEWKRLGEALQRRNKSPNPPPEVGASFPIPPSDDPTVWSDVLQAGYVANDLAAVDAAERKFLLPQEVETLHHIAEHFRPRFERWWNDNNQSANAFVPALKDALTKSRAFDLIGWAAAFYGADLGDGHLQIHVIALPKGKLTLTRAFRSGPHLVVEVVPGEQAQHRVDVVVHEMAHHVFGSMPLARKAAFMERMLAAGDGAVPSWSYFDEVQATVIGNIMAFRNAATPDEFGKQWNRPRSFYAVEPIDIGARATHQLFDMAFALGGPMRDDFPAAFVAAMRQGFGAKLETPAVYLNSMAQINLDPRDNDRKRLLRHTLHTTSAWEYDAENTNDFLSHAKKYPALSLAVTLRPDQLSQIDALSGVLAMSAAQVKDALASTTGAIIVARRSLNAYAFVLIARTDAAMDALIAATPGCSLKVGVCKRL
ncbi:MAG: hypothetical protein GC190_13215 [Alphaproteobacteria bacterium]|nr:hypothetical protein [Alphaproteobacteria bacterium]